MEIVYHAMEIVYHEWCFFQIIGKTTNGYRIQRLKNVIHQPAFGLKIDWVRITPMFDAADGDSFVITKSEREKYQTYDPERIYTIPRILALI